MEARVDWWVALADAEGGVRLVGLEVGGVSEALEVGTAIATPGEQVVMLREARGVAGPAVADELRRGCRLLDLAGVAGHGLAARLRVAAERAERLLAAGWSGIHIDEEGCLTGRPPSALVRVEPFRVRVVRDA